MVQIYGDLEELSLAAAKTVIERLNQAVSERRRSSVALSGGQTPRRLYEILASGPFRRQIPWDAVHVFWGDERCVPEDDPRSNARMARRALLDHVPLPPGNIHPIPCSQSPQEAAAHYETELKSFFGIQPPVFDLVLLGLGDNAHTASLFPHTPVLDEKNRWVAEVYLLEQDMYRVTLTAPIINQARDVIFLVSGVNKAPALQKVLQGPFRPHDFPAQLIRPKRIHPLWLVDKATSYKLSTELGETV
jgi:6-phosphogluconolactonase